jgi:hypothetical protein
MFKDTKKIKQALLRFLFDHKYAHFDNSQLIRL